MNLDVAGSSPVVHPKEFKMSKPKRIYVIEIVEDYIDINMMEVNAVIQKITMYIQEYKKNETDVLYFDTDYGYHSDDSDTIVLKRKRLENDKEYAIRTNKLKDLNDRAKEKKIIAEQDEITLYKNLRDKYEGKSI